MCDICKKVDFVLESFEMLLDDALVEAHIKEIARETSPQWREQSLKDQIKGARLSLVVLAMTELAFKYELDAQDLIAAVRYGIRRTAVKEWLRRRGELEDHHEELGGLQS